MKLKGTFLQYKNRKCNIDINLNDTYDKIRVQLMKLYTKNIISYTEISEIYLWIVRYNHFQSDIFFEKHLNMENMYKPEIILSDDKQQKRLF